MTCSKTTRTLQVDPKPPVTTVVFFPPTGHFVTLSSKGNPASIITTPGTVGSVTLIKTQSIVHYRSTIDRRELELWLIEAADHYTDTQFTISNLKISAIFSCWIWPLHKYGGKSTVLIGRLKLQTAYIQSRICPEVMCKLNPDKWRLFHTSRFDFNPHAFASNNYFPS